MFKKNSYLNKIIQCGFVSIFLFFVLVSSVSADKVIQIKKLKKDQFGLGSTAEKSGYLNTDKVVTSTLFADAIGKILGVALSLLGGFFMILIIYGGWMWMIAKGNEDEVKKAKEIVYNATIGIVIVFAAYVISNFIVSNLGTKINV